MSRRKHRQAKTAEPQSSEEEQSPERWAPPIGRPWQISLAAVCVVAWLAVLAYLAAFYSG